MRCQAWRAACIEANVERKYDVIRTELPQPLLDLCGCRHGHAADDDALHPESEQFRRDLARADAPADLDGSVRERSRQAGDCLSVAL